MNERDKFIQLKNRIKALETQIDNKNYALMRLQKNEISFDEKYKGPLENAPKKQISSIGKNDLSPIPKRPQNLSVDHKRPIKKSEETSPEGNMGSSKLGVKNGALPRLKPQPSPKSYLNASPGKYRNNVSMTVSKTTPPVKENSGSSPSKAIYTKGKRHIGLC